MHHYNALLFRASKIANACSGIAIVCSLGYLFLESSLVWCGYAAAWIFVSQGRMLLNRYQKKMLRICDEGRTVFRAVASEQCEQSLRGMLHVSYFWGIVGFRIQSLSCQAKYLAITNSAGPLPPVVRSWKCLEMENDGQYEWISPNTTFFLASARAARGDLGRRHKLSPKIKVRKGHRKRQELRDLTHVIVFSRLSSVNRLQAHLDANQPARGSTFVLQSCVLPHERVTTEIHGFENVWHRKGCFAWNRW